MAASAMWRLIVAVTAIIVVGIGTGVEPARATTLDVLLGGQSITAGDKTFSAWAQFGGNIDPSSLAFIDVQPLVDPPGNPGLRFVASNDVLAATGGELVDLGLQFTVSTPRPVIKDASLALTGFERTGSASLSIFEDLYTSPAVDDLVDLNLVYADAGGDQLFDGGVFDPRSLLVVQTTIELASGTAPGDFASVTQFEERFSQVTAQVPTPGALPLLSIGLAALGFFRTRQRRSQALRASP